MCMSNTEFSYKVGKSAIEKYKKLHEAKAVTAQLWQSIYGMEQQKPVFARLLLVSQS